MANESKSTPRGAMGSPAAGARRSSRRGRPRAGAIGSEEGFRRRLEAYVDACREEKRLPNVPGFCRFARITREDFAALRERFPLQYDIACSTFLDEALNTRAAGSASMMNYLTALLRGESCGEEGFTVLCDHDAAEDGQ